MCRHLRGKEFPIQHILADGSIESHEDAERRLLSTLGKQNGALFNTDAEMMEQAYEEQGGKIAYRQEHWLAEDEFEIAGRP